jgi:hypothetical protein
MPSNSEITVGDGPGWTDASSLIVATCPKGDPERIVVCNLTGEKPGIQVCPFLYSQSRKSEHIINKIKWQNDSDPNPDKPGLFSVTPPLRGAFSITSLRGYKCLYKPTSLFAYPPYLSYKSANTSPGRTLSDRATSGMVFPVS